MITGACIKNLLEKERRCPPFCCDVCLEVLRKSGATKLRVYINKKCSDSPAGS